MIAIELLMFLVLCAIALLVVVYTWIVKSPTLDKLLPNDEKRKEAERRKAVEEERIRLRNRATRK
jgi:uncharacterized ion transporter superfamily protein YfcC